MGDYIIKAAKYMLQLIFVFFIVYTLMFLLGGTSMEQFTTVFSSQRGLILLAAIVVLALIYPKMGYVTRSVEIDAVKDREAIMTSLSLCDYVLTNEAHNVMIFRKDNAWARLRMLYEDKITVVISENMITLSGNRREVVKLEYRIKSHIL